MENPLKYFAELSDPRVEGRREHLLEEILLITIAAVLSGADSWNEIENYGRAKREWLASFRSLPRGIPSHDTFNRVFSLLDPAELETCFLGWVSSIAKLTAGPKWWPLTARRYAAHGKAARRLSYTWSLPGPTPTIWCSASSGSMRNPTKSSRFQNCSWCWSYAEPP
jgi:hypothetical protein